MAGRVQLQPPGLLGALQLKTTGQAPQELGNNYAPTLELREWLLQANREWLSAVGSNVISTFLGFAPSGSSAGAAQVPQNEWWYVHQWLVFSSIEGATDLLVLQPAFAWDSNFGRVDLCGTPSPAVYPVPTTNTSILVSAHAAGVWVPPGSRMGAWIHLSDVAANRSLEFQASITRCQT